MSLQVAREGSGWLVTHPSGLKLRGNDRSALIDQAQKQGPAFARKQVEARRVERKQHVVTAENAITDEWRRRIALRRKEVRDWRNKGCREFAADYWSQTKQWRRRTLDLLKVPHLADALAECDNPQHTLREILGLLLGLPSDPRADAERMVQENMLAETARQGLRNATAALVELYMQDPLLKPLPGERNLLALLLRTQDVLEEDVAVPLTGSQQHLRPDLIAQRGPKGNKGYAARGLDKLLPELPKRASLIADLMQAAGIETNAQAVANSLR